MKSDQKNGNDVVRWLCYFVIILTILINPKMGLIAVLGYLFYAVVNVILLAALVKRQKESNSSG